MNQGSLKDAIVLFGGGCTGEIVSDKGCYSQSSLRLRQHFQSHSSLEKRLPHQRFLGNEDGRRIAYTGSYCYPLVYMKDVTKEVLMDVCPDFMTEEQRENAINKSIAEIIRKAVEGTHYTAVVKPI